MGIKWKKLGVQRGGGAARDPEMQAPVGYRDPGRASATKVCGSCGAGMAPSDAFFDPQGRELCGACHAQHGLAEAVQRAEAAVDKTSVAATGGWGRLVLNIAVKVAVGLALLALFRLIKGAC